MSAFLIGMNRRLAAPDSRFSEDHLTWISESEEPIRRMRGGRKSMAALRITRAGM